MLVNKLIFPVLNHVLASDDMARKLMASQAGKSVQIDLDGWRMPLTVNPEGYLSETAAAAPADVTLYLQKADLPLILQNMQRASAYVKLEGDADLANTISNVAQQVRWDAEADLAKLIGDIAAVRVVKGGNSIWQTMRRQQRSLQENLAEYLVEEGRLLPAKPEVDYHHQDIVNLRDDVERLLKRIEKLERR